MFCQHISRRQHVLSTDISLTAYFVDRHLVDSYVIHGIVCRKHFVDGFLSNALLSTIILIYCMFVDIMLFCLFTRRDGRYLDLTLNNQLTIQQCLKTLARRFKKKEIDLIKYVQDLSLLVATKKLFNMNVWRIFLFVYHSLPFLMIFLSFTSWTYSISQNILFFLFVDISLIK